MLKVKFQGMFFLLLLGQTIFAQDTIYKTNGEKKVVEMMQISGDALMFRQDSNIYKITSEGILKIKYFNGNVTDFAPAALKTNLPKVTLFAKYPDVPIETIDNSFFLSIMILSNSDVDKLIKNQNNKELQIKYLSLAKTENRKLFCSSIFFFTAFGTAFYYAFEQLSVIKSHKTASSVYLYSFGIGFTTFGIFAASNYYKAIEKRKELVQLYNSTYYPK